MDVMRNYEGYYDPTAGKAIRNVARGTRRGRYKISRHLTYRLWEIRSFQEWVKIFLCKV